MRIAQSNRTLDREVNLFAARDNSHDKPSTSTTSNLDQNHTNLKFNFPTYAGEGEDSTRWIFKVEQYFEFKNLNAPQQVQLASFHLSNVMLQWYRWYTKNRGQLHCNEFVKALLHHFGPTNYEDLSEALSRLKQTTAINAYQEAFEKFSHKMDDLLEKFLVGCFITRLKDEIHLDARVKQPQTLSESISVAHLIEEQNQFQKKTSNQIRPADLHSIQDHSRVP